MEELLSLQGGMSDRRDDEVGNDETLFIVVHQVYELWFKLVLRELVSVRSLLAQNPVPDDTLAAATRSIRRCMTIFEVAVHHFEVVETLTTRDYLAFRDQLIGASGFQSAQMREIEIVLGLEDRRRLQYLEEEDYKDALRHRDGRPSPALDRVERRVREVDSLRDTLYRWLARTPIDGSTEDEDVARYLEGFLSALDREAARSLAIAKERVHQDKDLATLERRYASQMKAARSFLLADDIEGEDARRQRLRVRAALVFIESHRDLPRLSWPRELLDAILTLEQRMIVWRQRHARMVERTIGRRVGTGGSDGVAYLDQTALRYRIFDDLWEARTILLRSEAVPGLDRAEDYRLRVQD